MSIEDMELVNAASMQSVSLLTGASGWPIEDAPR